MVMLQATAVPGTLTNFEPPKDNEVSTPACITPCWEAALQ